MIEKQTKDFFLGNPRKHDCEFIHIYRKPSGKYEARCRDCNLRASDCTSIEEAARKFGLAVEGRNLMVSGKEVR